MIAERIYNGETAEQIGIPEIQFDSRKEIVDKFLVGWAGADFTADFLVWLPLQEEGGANEDPARRFDKAAEGCDDCPSQHEMPSLPSRAGHFAVGIFKFIVEGMPLSTKVEAERKLALCEGGCEYFDGSVCRHTKCGCFSKIKTFFETESCPIGKW